MDSFMTAMRRYVIYPIRSLIFFLIFIAFVLYIISQLHLETQKMDSTPPGTYLSSPAVMDNDVDSDYMVETDSDLDSDYDDSISPVPRPTAPYSHVVCWGNVTKQTIIVIPDVGEPLQVLEDSLKQVSETNRICLLERLGFYTSSTRNVTILLEQFDLIKEISPFIVIGRGKFGEFFGKQLLEKYPLKIESLQAVASLGLQFDAQMVREMTWMSWFGLASLHNKYKEIIEMFGNRNSSLSEITHSVSDPLFWRAISSEMNLVMNLDGKV
jgi:hypothetical protein